MTDERTIKPHELTGRPKPSPVTEAVKDVKSNSIRDLFYSRAEVDDDPRAPHACIGEN